MNYEHIIEFLSEKGDKHTFIIAPVENYLNEYKLNFVKHVSEAAEPARLRRYDSLLKLLDIDKERFLESGQPMEEFGKSLGKWLKKERSSVHPFDPLEDDPSSLIAEALDWGSIIEDVVMEEDEVERYNKAWGAWKFFTERLGLDFSGINKRWLAAPELFIQPHVAQTEESPIVELYNEAVKAYVFGCKIASVAMCRALMEYILKKHYNVQGKDLENIIAIGEQRFPQLQKLKMQGKRLFSNKLLHNYETGTDIEDRGVIGYLRTIKMLVQDVPKKDT